VSLPKIPSEALSNDTELASSLDLLGQHKVGALLVMASPYFDTRRDRIIAAAAQNKLPAIINCVNMPPMAVSSAMGRASQMPPARRRLRGTNPQGRKIGRSSGPPADKI
jgi:hypothetical protein